MMASLTYCCMRISSGNKSNSSFTDYQKRSRRICCRSSHHHHHVKQIVLLIITFVVYVASIRNNATPMQQNFQNVDASFSGFHQQQQNANYQPMMPSNYEFQRPVTRPTAPPLLPTSSSSALSTRQTIFSVNQAKEANHQKEFRPSEQIYDFTLSDATPVTSNYPPSYLTTNYNPFKTPAVVNNFPNHHQQQQQQEMANKRYHKEENTKFAFPTETMNNIYNSNGPSSMLSTQQQQQYETTNPILTYKDPFTNEKFQAIGESTTTTTSTVQQFKENIADDDDANLIYYGNHQYQGGDIAAQQAYTVQSSLLVGSNGGGGGSNGHSNGETYRPLSSPNNEYKRPGYVFNEQIRPDYISSSSNINKFKQQQYSKPMPPQRLSYDSHDYPPPSYYQRPTNLQQQKQQQSTYFQSPQRQDIGLQPISQAPTQNFNYQPATATTLPSSSSSDYANNFGNYLLSDAQQQQQRPFEHKYQQQQQQQHFLPTPSPQQQHQQRNYFPSNQLRPPSAVQRPPSNYYDYQLGEIPPPPLPPNRRQPTPPPPYNYPPNYNGPQQRPPPQQPATSGLASLASLFTTTQQYAPQFTNLLLGAFTGGGGGGGGSGSIAPSSSSLRPQQQRPMNVQLIKALENIARNDDLQCVPKVLCQTIAGQTQRGQLPSFITSPAITNFLAGFPAASPALIYGRAALLGISGGESSCAQTYEKCPKNEYEILYYLNNHRGGFFKFFNEPEEQASVASTNSNGNYDDNGIGGSSGSDGGGVPSPLLSILTALTGGNPTPAINRRPTTTTTTTQRPPAAPTTLDVAGGIGNFFTQVLSDYLTGGEVEYQRRRRRRRSVKTEIEVDATEPTETDVEETKRILNDEDFHDEEDNEDTENDEAEDEPHEGEDEEEEQQYPDIEARILNKDERHADYPKFFPQEYSNSEETTTTIHDAVELFNTQRAARKFKFPSTQVNDRDPGKLGISWVNFEDITPHDETQAIDQHFGATSFKSSKRHGKKFQQQQQNYIASTETYNGQGSRITFPDHYERHIRKGRILNRPDYAASYSDYVRTTAAADNSDRFVIANNHRRPHYQDYHPPVKSLNGQFFAQTSSKYTSSLSSVSSSIFGGGGDGGGGNAIGNRYSAQQESGFRPTPLPVTSSSNGLGQSYTQNGKYNGHKGFRGSGSTSSSSSNSNYNSASSYSQFLLKNGGNYNYPNSNYDSSNRYSSNYQRYQTTSPTTTTRRPPNEDDPNIYVTDNHGINEYYIRPDGRKIYQRQN